MDVSLDRGPQSRCIGIGVPARDEDRAFFERELSSFVPERVFDAHCHLWPQGQLASRWPNVPAAVGAAEYRRMMEWLLPGRTLGSLFVPFPLDRATVAPANQWIARQVASDRAGVPSRGLFLVHPDDDVDWVAEQVRRLGLSGLKCYHYLAAGESTWELDIPAYLPERFMSAADRAGWVLLLHLVKARAVADAGNQHWLRHYCRTYPRAKLVLAHCARGFQPAHNLEGLPALTDLDNLYFDCSANCEAIAHESVIRLMGHRRLMYGSDFFVSHLRGRSVAAADSFLWLYEQTPVWEEKQASIRPVLAGLESLRALKWACWSAKLTDGQVEDIFWNNAAALYGLES